ncbi:MAG TPA: hypothetical protein VNE60_09460 [Gemmatimonadaceae bacterium]|nr:hypothetical protein [Gemmatimonadaceae bacterium]
MSRLSNPGCMLRTVSALFGTIFLPVGVSFLFVLRHAHWMEGCGAIVASLGFLYVAWRADDILGIDDIPVLPDLLPRYDLPLPPGDPAADIPASDSPPDRQEPTP